MFQLIKGHQLVPGIKYKIDNYTGYYKEKICLSQNYCIYYLFENVILNHFIIDNLYCSPMFYNFYTFVSQNPQWQMERRAVNLVLRRILGDEHFEW